MCGRAVEGQVSKRRFHDVTPLPFPVPKVKQCHVVTGRSCIFGVVSSHLFRTRASLPLSLYLYRKDSDTSSPARETGTRQATTPHASSRLRGTAVESLQQQSLDAGWKPGQNVDQPSYVSVSRILRWPSTLVDLNHYRLCRVSLSSLLVFRARSGKNMQWRFSLGTPEKVHACK